MEHAAHGGPASGHGSTDAGVQDAGAMAHSARGHAGHAPEPSPELPADATPRTPIPVITDADRAAAFPTLATRHGAHDGRVHSYWLADRLEWQDADTPTLAWEGLAWVGGDVDRLWLRTEGEVVDGRIEHGHAEVLYGRGVSAWWDVVAGIRRDLGDGPERTWAAIGVQGLAPYKFEVAATAYVGVDGRSMATLEAEYETLITGRLVLQWLAEATLHGRDDPEHGIASGLGTLEAGARLRYEIRRRFAPYVGLAWERAVGDTAELRRAAGQPAAETRLVAGVRVWF